MINAPKTANATYCATLCDQLWADGLTAAFVAPGSRSTPLALALVAHPDIAVEIMHDERSAAFAALGYGLATSRPALVLCSSGTAGAHFYAAVIEADAAAVPLIVVTADRPPELWGKGAPQTIDQTELYGSRVRAFLEPGCPDDPHPAVARDVARSMWLAAVGEPPGPVHLNQSFRDPLTGTADELPERLAPILVPSRAVPDPDMVARVRSHLDADRGVIVVGRSETDPADILALARERQWPVIGDHRSGCRQPDNNNVIRHFDALLRDQHFATSHRPDVVLRIGEIVSSKALSQWLSASATAGTVVVSSRPHGRHIDPEDVASYQFDEAGVVGAINQLNAGASAAGDATSSRAQTEWLAGWTQADVAAKAAIADVVASTQSTNEIEVAQTAVQAVPSSGALIVSSSMPVRDVEWYGPNRSDISVYANRGANGIDGVVATAIGVACSGVPTVCLIGDVAFLHDATSLTALRDRSIDLTIVVTNNDGGAIFSFLPQYELLDAPAYEELFGTPHGTDLAGLATAHGLAVEPFTGTVAAPSGIRIVVATTDRAENLALHHQINHAVASALRD